MDMQSRVDASREIQPAFVTSDFWTPSQPWHLRHAGKLGLLLAVASMIAVLLIGIYAVSRGMSH